MSADDGVVKIRVEQRHIDLAKRGDSTSCPIALAIREQHRVGSVNVLSMTAAIFLEEKWEYYFLPLDACSFIRHFDRGESVEPFEFEMEEMI